MKEFKKVENENGLSLQIVRGIDENKVEGDDVFIHLGGDDSNPSWGEYVNMFTDKYQPHVLLIKKAIEENGMIGYTGQDAQEYYFEFSDGEIWGYTWRAWGDLMQAIVNKREGYITYYM